MPHVGALEVAPTRSTGDCLTYLLTLDRHGNDRADSHRRGSRPDLRPSITCHVNRLLLRLVVLSVLVVGATIVPSLANVNAALPAKVRSGQYVRWVPEDIGSLVRLLRAEGTAKPEAAELAQIVHSESRALTLDPLYALALIKIESNFRANAVSPRGAIGLLQVRPETARSVAVATGTAPRTRGSHAARLRDPQTNVAVGLRYLRHLEGQFSDRTMALAAYNLGPSRVRHSLERGAPVPRAYTNRVLAAYRALAEATTGPSSAPRS